MNITFYSNVTTEEALFKNIPDLKAHNVKVIKLQDRERSEERRVGKECC